MKNLEKLRNTKNLWNILLFRRTSHIIHEWARPACKHLYVCLAQSAFEQSSHSCGNTMCNWDVNGLPRTHALFSKTPQIGQCSLGKTWSSNQTTHANLIAANITAALSPPCLCHVSMWSLCGRTVIPQPPFLLHRQIKESGGRNPLASDCSMSFLASGILSGKVSGLSGWSLDRIVGTLPRFSTFYRIDLWIDNSW